MCSLDVSSINCVPCFALDTLHLGYVSYSYNKVLQAKKFIARDYYYVFFLRGNIDGLGSDPPHYSLESSLSLIIYFKNDNAKHIKGNFTINCNLFFKLNFLLLIFHYEDRLVERRTKNIVVKTINRSSIFPDPFSKNKNFETFYPKKIFDLTIFGKAIRLFY